eukprot:GGOE01058500.1.p1 GENE.GGOE01058500.1~~GGOE01058500.1.p1  ORF type:complete len:578 (+),score=187.52 GGOE01058500.1:56-1789(+)
MFEVVAEELRERRNSILSREKVKEKEKEKEPTEHDRDRDHLVFWPLKSTEKLNLEKAILNYISTKHGRGRKVDWEDPVRRLSDIRGLIEEAPQKTPEEKFLKAHLLYAAMLTHAMLHFPLEDGRLGIIWTWRDTDGRNKCTTYSGNTEIGMVLFNTALLYCDTAGRMRQDNREELSRAFRLYHMAAGFFEAAQQRTANEQRLTPDMSAANLEALTKLCLAHALHMYYLGKLVENPETLEALTLSDTLSKVASDVAQAYYLLHPLYADDKLKDTVPNEVFYQVETWWQIFEMRAHLHLARVEHVNKLYGQEVGRLIQAREWLHRAERSCRMMGVKKTYEVIFRSKAELEKAEASAKVAMAEARQTPVTDFMKLPPVRGTGKNPLKPCPCNDSFLATCPEDPFHAIPLLGVIAPRPAMPSPPRCPSPPHSTPPLSTRSNSVISLSARSTSPAPQPPMSARDSRSGSIFSNSSAAPGRSASIISTSSAAPRRASFLGRKSSSSLPSSPLVEENGPPPERKHSQLLRKLSLSRPPPSTSPQHPRPSTSPLRTPREHISEAFHAATPRLRALVGRPKADAAS